MCRGAEAPGPVLHGVASGVSRGGGHVPGMGAGLLADYQARRLPFSAPNVNERNRIGFPFTFLCRGMPARRQAVAGGQHTAATGVTSAPRPMTAPCGSLDSRDHKPSPGGGHAAIP
jgi:hypothetical protein